MNVSRLRARAAEIQVELKQKSADLESGRISPAEFKAFVPKLVEEGEEIKSQLDLHKKATQYGAAADASMGWSAGVGSIHSAEPGPGELLRPVTPYDMTPDQLEQLIMAAKHRTPLRIEIAPKRYSDPVALKSMPSKWNLNFKTAVSESSISSSFSAAKTARTTGKTICAAASTSSRRVPTALRVS